MINETVREYTSPDGVVEVAVHLANGRVRVADANNNEIDISEVQAKWLATELNEQFGGGQTLDDDGVVFFVGQVAEESVKTCQKELLRIAFKKNKESNKSYITLILNTHGGYCTHGLALFDTIEFVRGMGIPIAGIVMGAAYSMGSVILQACSRRYVARHGRLMIHQVAGGASGKMDLVLEDVAEMKVTNRHLAEIYAECNTKGHNDPKFWLTKMSGKDKFMDGHECILLGLADDIYNPLIKWNLESDLK